jgi:hypothetical protein
VSLGVSQCVAFPSSSSHGGAVLDPYHCYVWPSTKTCKARVSDGGGAHDLSWATRPCVPRTRRRLLGVLCRILQAGIRYTITLVPLLIITVLRPRAAHPDPLKGLAYSGLHDSVWGLAGDLPWVWSVELFLSCSTSAGPGSGAKSLRGEVIHVKSGHGVDPYFDIPLPRSMKWWRKKCFYPRNDASGHTPFRERGNEASIRVPRMFKSHVQ